MLIPAFGSMPEVGINLSNTKEAENRLIEARTVNPVTYIDLEHCFNESYRELKKHMSTLGLHLTKAEKELGLIKAELLLDKYPDFLAEKTAASKAKGVKFQDSADIRDCFLIQDEEYQKALDHLAKLKAIESYCEGRIKVMENVCRYMRKQMDLVIRSGLSGVDLYVTNKGRQ